MPPGSRLDLPTQAQARPHGFQLDRCFVACFHSLPEFERPRHSTYSPLSSGGSRGLQTLSVYFSGFRLPWPISLIAIDNLGTTLFQDRSMTLLPGGHFAFNLTDRYPQLANMRGNLYITSDSGRLAAVGLRFAPGGSYTTLPIMNWTGMFP